MVVQVGGVGGRGRRLDGRCVVREGGAGGRRGRPGRRRWRAPWSSGKAVFLFKQMVEGGVVTGENVKAVVWEEAAEEWRGRL